MIQQLARILVYLLISITPAFADFGKVVDADGYVNVRDDKTAKSDIVGTIPAGEFVYFDDEDTHKDWLYIYPQYDDSGKEGVSGYIHKSRIDRINQGSDGYASDILMTYFDKKNQLIKFSDDGVRVIIKAEDFDYDSHSQHFTKKQSEGLGKDYYLSNYKGQHFWGTDGMLPKDMNHYTGITINIGDQIIKVPKNEVENFFGIGFTHTNVYYDRKTKSVYISALEGDGAGSYQVLFAIENGKYVGKTVVIPF